MGLSQINRVIHSVVLSVSKYIFVQAELELNVNLSVMLCIKIKKIPSLPSRFRVGTPPNAGQRMVVDEPGRTQTTQKIPYLVIAAIMA